MKISDLIKKLETAKEKYGDLIVATNPVSDINIGHVFFVDSTKVSKNGEPHIRLTDSGDPDYLRMIYEDDNVDTSIMTIKEIITNESI